MHSGTERNGELNCPRTYPFPPLLVIFRWMNPFAAGLVLSLDYKESNHKLN